MRENMDVELPYGKEWIEISISECYQILLPKKIKKSNENNVIKNALENPFHAETFDEFAKKSEKLLVIVNDATRPTPTSKVIEYLFSILSSHPNVIFLVATGAHRPPTNKEYTYIFGKHYSTFKNQIICHDARNEKEMTYIGETKKGTEVYINKLVLEYKNILVLGSVEPHYFAGYSGGRKSFLPGVCGYKTIEMNHKLALCDKARVLSLKGNPVHEDMIEVVNLLHTINIFSIQTILTTDHKIFAATAGDLHKSFDTAIKYAKQIFCVPLQQKGNIIITAASYPMDIDLYQSQKALENSKLALENDGIVILVSKCRMGVGDDSYLKPLEQAETYQDVIKKISQGYKLGYHKAAKMAQIGSKAEIWAVTDLDSSIIIKAMMKPYSDIQTAVDDAIKHIKDKGRKPKIVVLPFGSLTIPLVKKS
jgi:lactate racemase